MKWMFLPSKLLAHAYSSNRFNACPIKIFFNCPAFEVFV